MDKLIDGTDNILIDTELASTNVILSQDEDIIAIPHRSIPNVIAALRAAVEGSVFADRVVMP